MIFGSIEAPDILGPGTGADVLALTRAVVAGRIEMVRSFARWARYLARPCPTCRQARRQVDAPGPGAFIAVACGCTPDLDHEPTLCPSAPMIALEAP